MKRDTDDFAFLQNRSPAVAGIDRRIDLDREMRIDAGVRICLKINPRYNTARHRQPIAADGISIHRNRGFNFGNTTEAERLGAFEKLGIIDGQQRQIAIMRDMKHPRRIGLGIPFLADCQKAGITDHMGVRHDAFPRYNKSRAYAGCHLAGTPGRFVIRFL